MTLRLPAALVTALALACGSGSSSSSTSSGSTSTGGTGTISSCGTCPTGTVCSGTTCVANSSSSSSSSSSSVCTAAVEASDASSVASTNQVLHLGTFTVGSTASFTLPAGVAGFTIVEQAVSGTVGSITLDGDQYDDDAVPEQLTAPDGTVYYDDLAESPADGSTDLAFFASPSAGVGSLGVPNTSAALTQVAAGSGLPTGTWQLIVSDYAYECATALSSECSGGTTAAVYDVTVVLKAGTSGVPASGTLDVTFTFATTEAPGDSGTTTTPLTAATAPTDTDLARMVSSLRTFLGHANITLGTVAYRDLPASVQATYAAGVDLDGTGTCADLPQLLSHATSGTSIEVFFVSALTDSDVASGYQVVGVDGTVPGPATFPGTLTSGVAVSSADLRSQSSSCGSSPSSSCGADETAYVVAHEIGHFLGLYHTTEWSGDAYDPLSDTPTCDCKACLPTAEVSSCGDSSSSHLMTPDECEATTGSCGGGTNLMFWTISDGLEGVLSAEQGEVVRTSPVVR